MFRKASTPALAAAATLFPLIAAAQPDIPTPQPPTGGETRTCRFDSGPRKDTYVDYSATPGVAAVPLGDECLDMQGSRGAAVDPETRPVPAQGRYYASPDAPAGLDASGRTQPGWTLTCRFTSGPRAGADLDFTGQLGATPIRIGRPCSEGPNKGIGVAAGP